jgi:hypothetical protein
MTQPQMLSNAIELAVSTGLLHDVPSNGRLGHREVEVDAPVGTTVTVTWHVPLSGAVWTSRVGFAKSLYSDWFAPTTASLTADVPAGLLFDAQSRCTQYRPVLLPQSRSGPGPAAPRSVGWRQDEEERRDAW